MGFRPREVRPRRRGCGSAGDVHRLPPFPRQGTHRRARAILRESRLWLIARKDPDPPHGLRRGVRLRPSRSSSPSSVDRPGSIRRSGDFSTDRGPPRRSLEIYPPCGRPSERAAVRSPPRGLGPRARPGAIPDLPFWSRRRGPLGPRRRGVVSREGDSGVSSPRPCPRGRIPVELPRSPVEGAFRRTDRREHRDPGIPCSRGGAVGGRLAVRAGSRPSPPVGGRTTDRVLVPGEATTPGAVPCDASLRLVRSPGRYTYGTPDVGDGVKIGGSEGQRVRNLARRPPASSRELRSVRRFLTDRLPGLSAEPCRQIRCLYTNTPDKNFIVDFHPESSNVVLVSACSGHGFKFASALGELVAKGVRAGRLPPLLAPFGLSRFAGHGAPPPRSSTVPGR